MPTFLSVYVRYKHVPIYKYLSRVYRDVLVSLYECTNVSVRMTLHDMCNFVL